MTTLHTSQTAQAQWLNKQQAAKRLRVSARRVLEFARDGTLTAQRQRDPKSNQMAVFFSADSVEHMVHERENPKPIDVGEKPAPKEPKPSVARTADVTTAILAQLLERAERPALLPPTPPAATPWLTLDEAEAYLGLPSTVLRSLIDDAKLPAIDVGVRAGGRWRVKRADLDAIEGERLAKAQHA